MPTRAAGLALFVAVCWGCADTDGSGGAGRSGGSESTGGTANECVPRTCETLAFNCGAVPDGCGGELNCGSCATGMSCGATSPNLCGTGSCTPRTCAAGACGPMSDGCGNLVECGGCADGSVCTPDNQCEAPAATCTPKSCSELGKNCGTADDGCGGTLQCGTCSEGPTPGSVAWVSTFSTAGYDHVGGASTDNAGRIFLRADAPTLSGSSDTLLGLDGESGATFLSKELPRPYRGVGLFAHPTGESLVMTVDACGDNSCPPNAWATVTYQKDGTGPSTVPVTDGTPLILGLSVQRTIAELFGDNPRGLRYRFRSGQASTLIPPASRFNPYEGTFDPSGNFVVVGSFEGETGAFQGRSWSGLVLFRFSPTGQFLWGQELPSSVFGQLRMGTTNLGTIVVAIARQSADTSAWSFAFGGDSVSPERGAILIYEANGAERLAFSLPGTNESLRLGVDPAGRAYVAWLDGCERITVQKFDLTGQREWASAVPLAGCGNGYPLYDVKVSSGAPVIIGTFEDPTDFGTGLIVPRNRDVFIAKLRP